MNQSNKDFLIELAKLMNHYGIEAIGCDISDCDGGTRGIYVRGSNEEVIVADFQSTVDASDIKETLDYEQNGGIVND